ncbi:MAG: PAAR domain-containing protein [Formivibrio sp.]|nr:PAAR domain-containing protein [Formivibrio sp.]
MPNVIRLGDATSHGGVVVSASGTYSAMEKPIARLGDRCTCPIKGHGGCVIAEGDSNWTIDGVPVALEGHKTSCGASLISSSGNCNKS